MQQSYSICTGFYLFLLRTASLISLITVVLSLNDLDISENQIAVMIFNFIFLLMEIVTLGVLNQVSYFPLKISDTVIFAILYQLKYPLPKIGQFPPYYFFTVKLSNTNNRKKLTLKEAVEVFFRIPMSFRTGFILYFCDECGFLNLLFCFWSQPQ